MMPTSTKEKAEMIILMSGKIRKIQRSKRNIT